MLQQIGFVAIGGAIGAALCYAVGEWLSSEGFPIATLTVNLVGSLALGFLTVAVAQNLVSSNVALIVATGVLGAFTTMSTFSAETIDLFDRGDSTLALIYVGLTMMLCPLLAFIGWKAGEALWI